jgi:predicted  nucleic acid-binding Zn-ribbon protein
MVMDNYLRIRDLVNFSVVDADLSRIRDSFSFQQTEGLKVRIAATHAGIITHNNMLYLPDKMKSSVKTFVEGFGKPVLKHHMEEEDPIGRIVDAYYVDTSKSIRDNYVHFVGFGDIKDSAHYEIFDNFCNGVMSFEDQVDLVRRLLVVKDDKHTLLEKLAHRGLGHAQIIADISDPDAIQKFIDQRYLTGSVGARTSDAVCSVCKQNWTKSDSCDHVPGRVYDDLKCVLIAGKFIYDEYSVVNKPADGQSVVLELYYGGKLKNIEVTNQLEESLRDVRLGFPQYDLNFEEEVMDQSDATTVQDSVQNAPKVEDTSVKKTEAESEVVGERANSESFDDFLTRVLQSDKTLGVEDEARLYDLLHAQMTAVDAKLSSKQRKALAKSTFCGPDRSYPVPDRSHAVAALARAKQHASPALQAKIKACVCRKFPGLPACSGDSLNDSTEWTDVLTAELKEKGEVIFGLPSVTDAPIEDVLGEDVLTDEARHSGLRKSSFCGPNRTFPVTNAAHYFAAIELLDSYKGSVDVSKIRNCLDRKAKARGFLKNTTDSVEHARLLHMLTSAMEEYFYSKSYRENDGKAPILSDDDKDALVGVLKSLAVAVGQDSLVSALNADVQELRDVLKVFQDVELLDEIMSLETELGKVRDELIEVSGARDALKEEYEFLQKDADQITDEVLAVKTALRTVKQQYLVLLTTLTGKEQNSEELARLSDEILETSLQKLAKEVDIKKIADKLNDGTDHKPEGEVDDPSLKIEDQRLDKEGVLRTLRDLEEKYMTLKFKNSRFAEQWRSKEIVKLKKAGKLPEDIR